MANRLRGEARIGGTDKTLVFDINALCSAEQALDTKIAELLPALAEGVSLVSLRALVWAGLQRMHPCTMEEAGDVISDAGMEPVMAAMQEAMAGAFPQEERKANPRKRAQGGSGSGS